MSYEWSWGKGWQASESLSERLSERWSDRVPEEVAERLAEIESRWDDWVFAGPGRSEWGKSHKKDKDRDEGGEAPEVPDPDPAPNPEPAPEPEPTPAEPPVEPPSPQPDPEPAPAPDLPRAPAPEPAPAPSPPASGTPSLHVTFDNGTGPFGNDWGLVDYSVPGQVTLTSRAGEWNDSGLMMDASSPLGFGHFTMTLTHNKAVPGAYGLLWPPNWPGPELDLVEVLSNGTAYSTIHRNEGGRDAYQSFMLDGVDPAQTHTYGLTWELGRLTGYVDGREMWTTTEHVPLDAAHGGVDLLASVGTQTWWNIADQGGTDRTVTFHDFTYTAIA